MEHLKILGYAIGAILTASILCLLGGLIGGVPFLTICGLVGFLICVILIGKAVRRLSGQIDRIQVDVERRLKVEGSEAERIERAKEKKGDK